MALRATPIPHKATPWVIGGLVTLPFALSWDFTQLDTTPGKHSSAQIVFGFLLYLFIASFMCYFFWIYVEEYGWHCSFEDMSGVLHDLKKDLIIEYIGSGNYQFVSQEPEPNGRARF